MPRPDDTQDADDWGTGRLPRELAGRFEIDAHQPPQGGEADTFRVRDRHGRRLILKLYRRGFHPDPEVWAALQGIASDHVVRMHETGTAGGRSYELMEELPPVSLRDLLEDASFRLRPEQLAEMVAQVAEALTQLHERGVRHGDVKPDNILVRSRDPLDLAVVDFGISRHLPTTEAFASTVFKTFAYAAPEVFANMASKASDWWALGMTVAELAVGRHPFDGLSDAVVALQVTTRPIDVSAIPDPRLRLLCQGLIVRDPDRRWGAEAVRRWVAGESPDLPPSGAEGPRRDPFEFLGQRHTERASLALAMADNWEAAAALLFGPDANQRVALRSWLDQFAELDRDGSEGRNRVFDELERGTEPPDVRLLMLLRWLAPGLPPTYRRCRVAPADLPELARVALSDNPDIAPQLIGQLSHYRLLGRLDVVGSFGLAAVDERWQTMQARWHATTAWLRRAYPRLERALGELTGDQVDAELLWLATVGSARRDTLRAEVAKVQEELRLMRVPVPWLQALASSDDPVHALAAALLTGAAVNEAQGMVEERKIAELEAAAAQRASAWDEWVRRQDRPHAVGWAAASIVTLLAVWVGVLVLSDAAPLASPAAINLAWILALLAIGLVGAVEVLLAAGIGGNYHRDYSMLHGMVAAGAKVARPLQHNGLLGVVLILAAGGALVAATSLAPYALPALAVGAHAYWTWRRHGRWRRDRATRREHRVRNLWHEGSTNRRAHER